MWFKSPSNVIHAVPCVKWYEVHVFDDFKFWWFIASFDLLWNVPGFSVVFAWGFGTIEASWRTRAASVTWHVWKMLYFGATSATSFQDSANLLVFTPILLDFLLNETIKQKRALARCLWTETRSRSGYALTVSGPATSARLKPFVKGMLVDHHHKSKQMNRP